MEQHYPLLFDELPEFTLEKLKSFFEPFALEDLDIHASDGGSSITAPAIDGEVKSAVVLDSADESLSLTSGGVPFSIAASEAATVVLLQGSDGPLPFPQTYTSYFRKLIDEQVGRATDDAVKLHDSLNQLLFDPVDPAGDLVQVLHIISDDVISVTTAEPSVYVALNINRAGGVVHYDAQSPQLLVIGAGEVHVAGATESIVFGDLRDQVIVGGDGQDIIYSNGGHDSFTGGNGDDVFGFSGGVNTHLTITDFEQGDRLLFRMEGISNLEELKRAMVSTNEADGNFTASFDDGSSLTLLGVAGEDIRAYMIDIALV